MENEQMTPVVTEVETEVVETAQPQAKFKINYLGEEKEIDFEEAKTLAQKGMDYDRQKEKWETVKPTVDSFEEIARGFGFVDEHGHGDTKAYIEAVREAKRQEEIEALNLPKELAEELYLSRQDRQEREKFAKVKEEESKRLKENTDFLDYFKEIHGRDWTQQDGIPEEVKKLNEQGIPLRFAYAEHLTKKMTSERQIEQKNLENQETSPGSISANGTPSGGLTEEMVENMTPQELASRWGEVKKLFNMK